MAGRQTNTPPIGRGGDRGKPRGTPNRGGNSAAWPQGRGAPRGRGQGQYMGPPQGAWGQPGPGHGSSSQFQGYDGPAAGQYTHQGQHQCDPRPINPTPATNNNLPRPALDCEAPPQSPQIPRVGRGPPWPMRARAEEETPGPLRCGNVPPRLRDIGGEPADTSRREPGEESARDESEGELQEALVCETESLRDLLKDASSTPSPKTGNEPPSRPPGQPVQPEPFSTSPPNARRWYWGAAVLSAMLLGLIALLIVGPMPTAGIRPEMFNQPITSHQSPAPSHTPSAEVPGWTIDDSAPGCGMPIWVAQEHPLWLGRGDPLKEIVGLLALLITWPVMPTADTSPQETPCPSHGLAPRQDGAGQRRTHSREDLNPQGGAAKKAKAKRRAADSPSKEKDEESKPQGGIRTGTWNMNGLTPLKYQELGEHLLEHRIQMVILTETHLERDSDAAYLDKCDKWSNFRVDFENMDADDPNRSRRGGVMLMVSKQAGITVAQVSKKHGTLTLGTWRLSHKLWDVDLQVTGVYRSPSDTAPDLLEAQFQAIHDAMTPANPRHLARPHAKHTLCLAGGDFNAHGRPA